MRIRWAIRFAVNVTIVLFGLLGALAAVYGNPEYVTFEVKEPNAEAVSLTGFLTKPSSESRFPAVVLLHGCGGMHPLWGGAWAERLHRWGYVTLQVDSFGPRGDIFATPEEASAACIRKQTASTWTRAYDAHAARAYLSSLPFVDAERIAVMGQSHGGDAVLWAVSKHPRYIAKQREPGQFAAAIALYPSCFEVLHRLDAPLLVLVGELDRSTPAYRCEKMRLEGDTPHALRLKIYPDAHHVFDVDAPERVVVGQTMAYNATASADAFHQVRSFLDEYLQ
jgi:dienelactone hydrolase